MLIVSRASSSEIRNKETRVHNVDTPMKSQTTAEKMLLIRQSNLSIIQPCPWWIQACQLQTLSSKNHVLNIFISWKRPRNWNASMFVLGDGEFAHNSLQGILAVSVDGAGGMEFWVDVHNHSTQFFPSGFHLTSGDCISSPVMKDLNEDAYLQFLIIPIEA